MVILYSFPYRLGRTGIGSTAWHQVAELIGRGQEVLLFTGSCEKPVPGLRFLRETLRPGGVRLPISALGVMNAALLHDAATARALPGLRARLDCIHGWPLASRLTFQAARRLGIRTFIERPNAHTAFAFEAVEGEYRKLGLPQARRHPHTRQTAKLSRELAEYDLADFILCPSAFVEQSFLDRGFPPAKLRRHRYGYDPARFFPPAGGRRREACRRYLFLGRGEPRKGLHTLLAAWRSSKACHAGATLSIAGALDPAYARFLGDGLRQPGVRLLGFRTDPAELLREADALVLPSIEEGSALVTYEARACGCVLLVSAASGAIATPGHDALLHRVGDADSLREHIDRLFADPDLFGRLRANSLSGRRQLTWAAAAQALEEIYRQRPATGTVS